MIKFIGEHISKLDDKGRLIFPVSFKSLLEEKGDYKLVVRKDLYESCLEIFSYEEWERQSEMVKSKLNFFKPEHAQFWREYMKNRALVEPDQKIGRISIPKKLLDSINASKELVFSGNDHKIELWAKEIYESKNIQNDEYISLAQRILG